MWQFMIKGRNDLHFVEHFNVSGKARSKRRRLVSHIPATRQASQRASPFPRPPALYSRSHLFIILFVLLRVILAKLDIITGAVLIKCQLLLNHNVIYNCKTNISIKVLKYIT